MEQSIFKSLKVLFGENRNKAKEGNKKGEKMKGEGVPTPPPQPGQATFSQLPVNGA